MFGTGEECCSKRRLCPLGATVLIDLQVVYGFIRVRPEWSVFLGFLRFAQSPSYGFVRVRSDTSGANSGANQGLVVGRSICQFLCVLYV